MNSEQASMAEDKPLHHQAIEYIIGDSLSRHSVKMTRAELKRLSREQQWGWTHLGKTKDTLKMASPIAVLSLPQLIHSIDRQGMNFWRPNLMFSSKSAKQRQIRWLTSFFFDFDPQHLKKLDILSPDDLLKHVHAKVGIWPTLIIKTPSGGYHIYLPLKRTRGMVNGQKTIPRYGIVMRHITNLIGSDIHAASAEHYMRAPKARSVVYFSKATYVPTLEDYEELLEINTQYLPKRSLKDSKIVGIEDYRYNRAIDIILSGQFQQGYTSGKGKKRKVGRNNAAFTLSLAFKASGLTMQEAEEKIITWHRSGNFNTAGFELSEAIRALRHAYEGPYKGPSNLYLEALTGISCRFKIITPRKPRGERRDHLTEIVQDVHKYLKEHGTIEITQQELANKLGVALRSLVEVLKTMRERGEISVTKIRNGRTWISRIELVKEPEMPTEHTKEDPQNKDDDATEKVPTQRQTDARSIHPIVDLITARSDVNIRKKPPRLKGGPSPPVS